MSNNFQTPVVQNLKNVVYQNSMLPSMSPLGVGVEAVSDMGCLSVYIPDSTEMPELMTYGWQQQLKNKRTPSCSVRGQFLTTRRDEAGIRFSHWPPVSRGTM